MRYSIPGQAHFAALATRLRGKHILFVDHPMHLNLGDLLIYQGTCALLRDCDARRVAELCQFDISAQPTLPELPSGTVVVCQGGGNFGDIYPHFMAFRRRVITHYQQHPVILLPQTISFAHKQPDADDFAPLLEHPDLTFCVRDHASLDLARSFLPEERTLLIPDMACYLAGSLPVSPPSRPRTLIMRRRDRETIGQNTVKSMDWGDLLSRNDHRAMRWLRRLVRWQRQSGLPLGAYRLFDFFAGRLTAKAMRCFMGYSEIDSDRLHGLILGLLLERDLTPRDNLHGKLTNYFSTWHAAELQ